ncbi:hypothetical protein RRG08_037742 [Elysia crispata]|uniref:Uncharacterized protein n=1 Tax=Elysia crispata TaxID=231223 RepID=A0AAE1DV70_9GAST|nr:hypothetical protein RRG08_037742 [Elysia crispata]
MDIFDDYNESGRARADVARGATDEIIPLEVPPVAMGGGDYVITGNAETSFSTNKVDAYGRPMINTLAYVEGEYVDVFDTSRLPLEQKNIAGAANDYYRMLAKDQNIKPELPDLSNFIIDGKGRLRLRDYPKINLINEITKRPNKLITVAGYENGRVAIREKLGIPAWTPEMSKAADAELRKYNQSLEDASKSLDTGGATEAVKSTQKIIAVLASGEIKGDGWGRRQHQLVYVEKSRGMGGGGDNINLCRWRNQGGWVGGGDNINLCGEIKGDGWGEETTPTCVGGEIKGDGWGEETTSTCVGGEIKGDGWGEETTSTCVGGEIKGEGGGEETTSTCVGGEIKGDGWGEETTSTCVGGEIKGDGWGEETTPTCVGGEIKGDRWRGGDNTNWCGEIKGDRWEGGDNTNLCRWRNQGGGGVWREETTPTCVGGEIKGVGVCGGRRQHQLV